MLYACGLRISEALGLNRKQAPEGDSMVITGKGNKQRLVPVLAVVHEKIDAYLAACPYEFEPDDPLFVGRNPLQNAPERESSFPKGKFRLSRYYPKFRRHTTRS